MADLSQRDPEPNLTAMVAVIAVLQSWFLEAAVPDRRTAAGSKRANMPDSSTNRMRTIWRCRVFSSMAIAVPTKRTFSGQPGKSPHQKGGADLRMVTKGQEAIS